MPKLEKGSAAAKERMAHLRSLRNKKEVGTGGFCSKCSKDSTNRDSLETKMKKAGEKQQFQYDDNAGLDFEKTSTLFHDTEVQKPASLNIKLTVKVYLGNRLGLNGLQTMHTRTT